MKAVIYTEYGGPDVLKLREMRQPAAGDDDVLVKVEATTVTATDCTFRRGSPPISRLYTGLRKPKQRILGSEFIGVVVEAGQNVSEFAVGERVFGTLPGAGAYAEYLCLPVEQTTLARAPSRLTPTEALACCDGFLTALPFLRDTGRLEPGQDVLIYGASGSVGSAAVQLARHFGANVTGVCSSRNVEMVRSLGAANVIDYTREDFTRSGQRYDLIFDAVGKLSFLGCRAALKPHGVFLEAGISLSVLPFVLWTAKLGSKQARINATGMRSPSDRTRDLAFIRDLADAGEIVPVVDRCFPLDQIAEAHRYVDGGHKRGNVIVTMEDIAERRN